jgi:hypothetical protein
MLMVNLNIRTGEILGMSSMTGGQNVVDKGFIARE